MNILIQSPLFGQACLLLDVGPGQPLADLERYMDTIAAKSKAIGKMIKDLDEKVHSSAESTKFLVFITGCTWPGPLYPCHLIYDNS